MKMSTQTHTLHGSLCCVTNGRLGDQRSRSTLTCGWGARSLVVCRMLIGEGGVARAMRHLSLPWGWLAFGGRCRSSDNIRLFSAANTRRLLQSLQRVTVIVWSVVARWKRSFPQSFFTQVSRTYSFVTFIHSLFHSYVWVRIWGSTRIEVVAPSPSPTKEIRKKARILRC